jgi:hypothetical protein
MILTKDSLATKNYVRSAQDMFEDVMDSYTNRRDDNRKINILDYVKILKEIHDFIEGFINYKSKGTNEHASDIAAKTVRFYNSMFVDDKRYRHKMPLKDFPKMQEEFLNETKRLQSLMESHVNESNIDPEMKLILQLTDNQYRKLAKVNRDDMAIFLWLMWANTFRSDRYDIPPRLRMMFNDPTTPVMHLDKKDDD